MWALLAYGSCVFRVTNGPDKPRHIFAGRNDMETTMTKPQFDVWNPLPGSEDAPIITAEQMSNFLHNHIGSKAGKEIAAAINSCPTPDFYGALQVTYVPPKPTFLPIDRPVRGPDLEKGDILRFCGAPGQEYFIDNGYLTVGKEYVVGPQNAIDYDVPTKQGVVRGYWGTAPILTGWSFVRRPFKAGEAVRYKAEAMGWEGALLVATSETDRPVGYGIAVMNHKGVLGSIKASDLERIL
jgi:hypothetical protein